MPWLLRWIESLSSLDVFKGVFGAHREHSIRIVYRLGLLSPDFLIHSWEFEGLRAWNAWTLPGSSHAKLGCYWRSMAVLLHAFWKILIEAHILWHVLYLRCAEVFWDTSYLVCLGLFHEEDEFRVIGSLLNPLEMQCIVHLILGLNYFIDRKVVMSLFQSVKSNVLIVIVVGFLLPASHSITLSCHGDSLGSDRVIQVLSKTILLLP